MRGSREGLRIAPAAPDPLVRGGFTDGRREFTVCASGPVAPDSFQVFANGNRADIVMIVSGLNSGDLHATWGDEWRASTAEWREWARTCAFHVFENGSLIPASDCRPKPNRAPDGAGRRSNVAGGEVKFCDG